MLDITPTQIRTGLRTAALPGAISCYGQVGSTMDLARELLGTASDADLPLLVVADEQTSGRGRMGRSWVAPPGSALLCSIGLRPTWLAPERSIALVWMAGVALCEAVAATTPLQARLKWPNDLLVEVRRQKAEDDGARCADTSDCSRLTSEGWAKAAGILLESSLGPEGLVLAIIGCGVNVSAGPPPGVARYPTTSLAEAGGAPVSRLELLRAFLTRLDHWHERLRRGMSEELFQVWRGRLHTLGREVEVAVGETVLRGVAEDVALDGALLLRNNSGGLHVIRSGDVGMSGL